MVQNPGNRQITLYYRSIRNVVDRNSHSIQFIYSEFDDNMNDPSSFA